MPISYSQAVLGARLDVPTLKGPEHVDIPQGTQHGDVFRLRQRGIADPRGGSVGDLLVQVYLEVPKKTSARQETLLRELAELERNDVTPHRTSFLEKLRDYFALGGEDSSKEV
jgi:molecular chaperone DnaJ